MEHEHDLPQSEARQIKLTALALGELSEAEAAELLAESEDPIADRQVIAELKRLGDCLRQTPSSEPVPSRSDALRQALGAKLEELAAPPLETHSRHSWPRRRYWLPLSLAASVLLVCGVVTALIKLRHVDEHEATVAMHGKVDELDRLEVQTDGVKAVDDAIVDSEVKLHKAGPKTRMKTRILSAVPVAGAEGVESYGMQDHSGKGAAHDFAIIEAGGSQAPQPAQPTTLDAYSESEANDKGYFYKPRTNNGQGIPTGRQANGRLAGPDMPRSTQTAPVAGGSSAQSRRWHYAGGAARTEGGRQFGRGGIDATTETPGGMPEEMPSRFGEAPGMMPGGMRKNGAGGLAGMPVSEGEPISAGLGMQTQSWDAPPAYAESYSPIVENAFVRVSDSPLSTFSIDVDTASYANVRRFLNSNTLPPADAVRVEELINYFSYDYPQPEGEAPFSITTEVAGCPWSVEHRLLRIGLHGREMASEHRPAGNLAFLVDVSGSMDQPDKLPLVKESLLLLTEQLEENDRVAIVTYAGNSGLALAPTSGSNKRTIETAISSLSAGGSTNGGEGIQTAYAVTQGNFIKGGVNRVILATDGDFNVGVTDQNELVKLIEEKAHDGVFFTALGFGTGNLKDGTLEKLADKGNGNYAYIDTVGEARKVLVEQLAGTLVTIAKDVKLQLEFNPTQVDAYRLIGYENRVLAHADFNDDRKDAGDVGAGHTVTALYELVPPGAVQGFARVDELKYQRPAPALKAAADSNELLTLKLRYKQPDGETSRLLEHAVTDPGRKYGQAAADFKFAAAVAAFGMRLRGSQHVGGITYDAVLELADEGRGKDPQGYRAEFVELVKKAKTLAAPQ